MTTKNSTTTLTGKIYYVSGSLSGVGEVKVINVDGSNEITLVQGRK